MNNKSLTNKAQFRHKSITKPTISPVDKIMAAISDCARDIKNMGDINCANEMQKLLHLTERAVQHYPAITAESKITPSTTTNMRGIQPALRVPPSGNQTQKMGFKIGGWPTTATTAAKQDP